MFTKYYSNLIFNVRLVTTLNTIKLRPKRHDADVAAPPPPMRVYS